MSEKKREPIAPYMAVGLSTVVYGIAQRKHIKYNLKTVEHPCGRLHGQHQYACQGHCPGRRCAHRFYR